MMKKVAMIALLAVCASGFGESFTGLVVDKGGACVLAKPESPKEAIANIMWNLKSEVVEYAGKVVTIEGTLDPSKDYPTLESITSITEVK